MSEYKPHPAVAKEMGIPGSEVCVCTTPMQAMFCPFGHMLECHYPMTCSEAHCDHYRREGN
jgi:hypothetical protein